MTRPFRGELPPTVILPPVLSGAGKIGQAMRLVPGLWSGAPLTGMGCQWLRNGFEIPGAVGPVFVPGDEDDLSDLGCRVSAVNPAGRAEVVAGPVRLTHAAPVAAGELFEEVFDQGSGVWTVAAAEDFTGRALRFSVSGAGASVDPVTGIVAIPTETPRAGERVTVTARNSGGVAESGFVVTVEAWDNEEAEEPVFVAAQDNRLAPEWRLLRYQTRAELEAGVHYGDPEQFQQCVARSASDPDRIYLGQDIGPIRRSDDGGATWQVCVARGLRNAYFLGGAVDPVNPDVFMVQCHNRLGRKAQAQAGIWRTTDAGVTFARVLATDPVGMPKIVADTIAPAPGLVDRTGARRWYCAFAERPIAEDMPGASGFWMSDDYGVTWIRRARALPLARFGNVIFRVAVSPADPERIWMGTGTGLFRSDDGGQVWEPVSGAAPGACTHIEIDPERAERIFVCFAGIGAFLTDDGFASPPAELFAWEKLHRAFPHPADWNVCIRLPRRGNTDGLHDQAEVSGNALARLDGGDSRWTRCDVPVKPGARSGWWNEITGEPSTVRWHPADLSSAFASARGHLFRTRDRGLSWLFSNEGVSGFNYGNASISTEFMFDHFDSARIFMPHADVGILATHDRFRTFEAVRDYERRVLRSASTETTCNVCALQPLAGSRRIVAAVGDYNASTLVFSPDGGASWTRIGPSADGDTVRCWSISYALTEPNHCYATDHHSEDGGATWHRMPALAALGETMLVLAVSRRNAGATGPALYAADHRGRAPYRDLWKSTDRGETWTPVWAYPRGSLRGEQGNAFDAPVFRVDPRDPDAFFAAAPAGPGGGVPGSISRFDTRTGRWRHFDVWQALPREYGNFVSRIAIDWHRAATAPGEPLILYVQLAHVGMRNVLRSIDDGERWENMTYDGTNAVGQGFEVHPLTGELFSGGEAGTRMLQPPYATSGTVGAQPWSRPNNIALTP